MSDQTRINPYLKTALELGPTLLFFVAYLKFKDQSFNLFGHDYKGFIVVVAGFVPILLASIAVLWWLTGKLSRMQVFTATLVVVFAGLTVWFDSEVFFKMKTTIFWGLLGGLLGIGLLRGESWLVPMMGELMPLRHEGWMLLAKIYASVFLLMAMANELVWRTQSTEFWVTFETFFLPFSPILATVLMFKYIEPHFIEPDESSGED